MHGDPRAGSGPSGRTRRNRGSPAAWHPEAISIDREILGQDPRDCNYLGNAEVGKFLEGILALGATRDWDAVLREATGEPLTARPMMAYFAPLMDWLKERNRGRKVGWA